MSSGKGAERGGARTRSGSADESGPRRPTVTGGREATTRHIPPKLALAVGMPSTPAPTGWQWAPLTLLARLESGHTPSRRHPEYWGGTIPWIGIQDAKANHSGRIHDTLEQTNDLGIANSSARVLPENTVCLSRTASVGYVIVMGRPMATSQDFVNWVCSKDLDHEFLKYLFIAEGKNLLRFAGGAVHPTIYFPEVKAFHICFPRLPEQRRIVGILDEAFAGIASAKAHAEKNLQNARELFESHLQAVFSKRDSAHAVRRLDEVCDEVTVGHVGSMAKHYRSDGIPFLRSQNIRPFRISLENMVFIDETFHRSLAKSQLRPGDVAVVRTGYPGTAAVIPESLPVSNCSDLVIVRPGADVEPDYLAMFFNSSLGRELVAGRLVGAAQKHFNITAAKQVSISFPPILEQRRLVSELQALASQTQRLESVYERKLATIDELRRSLLHQAFTGEL